MARIHEGARTSSWRRCNSANAAVVEGEASKSGYGDVNFWFMQPIGIVHTEKVGKSDRDAEQGHSWVTFGR
jgi:hypothetical protein